ncbi:hypothetical protein PENSPDRAFT_654967 [Peniophora sp. CONT]|nr:hypothetical protein PENSPDRAFT_654967 [Peniophora sp. CONT]
MADSIAQEAALDGLPPYSPAWTSNHNTIVVSTNTTRDPSVPPEYSPSRSETPSLYSDADASSSSSSSGPATPASIFSKQLDEEDIEEAMCEDQDHAAELACDATVIAGPSTSRKRSRTVSTTDEDLDFEPHVAKPPPRKRARATRRAIVESDADSSDSDSDEPPARKHKVTKRGGVKPVICRCGHAKCQSEPGFSSVRVYERHYRSVHLGSSTDVRCKGCNLSFESGRKDSVIRHQNQNNGEKCRGTGIIMPDKTRRAPVPKAIML